MALPTNEISSQIHSLEMLIDHYGEAREQVGFNKGSYPDQVKKAQDMADHLDNELRGIFSSLVLKIRDLTSIYDAHTVSMGFLLDCLTVKLKPLSGLRSIKEWFCKHSLVGISIPNVFSDVVKLENCTKCRKIFISKIKKEQP